MSDFFETVERSYDRMGEAYHQNRDNEKFAQQLNQIGELLPSSGRVLDAGCGVGRPTAEFFAQKGFDVTGVDISKKMIELARQNVPRANFLQKNIATFDFPNASFDGIVCIYTLWHIPRENHPEIIKNFNRMLDEEGILVLNTGLFDSEGMSTFFGQPMLWSNYSPSETLEVVRNSGFEIIFEGVLKLGGERQYWIFAKKLNTSKKRILLQSKNPTSSTTQ